MMMTLTPWSQASLRTGVWAAGPAGKTMKPAGLCCNDV